MRSLLVLLILGAVAATPGSAVAAFDKCSLASVANGQRSDASGPDGSFPLVKIVPGVTATLKFSCPGAPGTPTLARQSGLTETAIGPAVPVGDLWTFAVTLPGSAVPNSGQSTRLVFQEPGGGATQVVDVIPVSSTAPNPLNFCETEGRGLVEGEVEAKPPGASGFTPVPGGKLCALMELRDISGDATPREGVSYNVLQPTAPGEVPWPYPDGTVFRVTGEFPGFRPVAAAGTIRNPRIQLEGNRFAVEGEAVTRKVFDASLGEAGCAGAETRTVFGGTILGAWAGDLYRGTAVANNGYTSAAPRIGAGGTIEYFVAGCGDGDPSTLEGFYDAQFGKPFLDSGGITQPVLLAADDSAVQAMFNVTNNGQASSAAFRKAPGPDGTIVVLMNYRTSFSEHTIGVRANRKATAFARKCTKAKGSRLRTKKQSIKVGKKRVKATFLTCTPRKGRPSSLRVG